MLSTGYCGAATSGLTEAVDVNLSLSGLNKQKAFTKLLPLSVMVAVTFVVMSNSS